MTEEIVFTSGESDEMSEAMAAAQRTFLEFSRHAEFENSRIVPCFEAACVKGFFPEKQDGSDRLDVAGEHMFVNQVFTDRKFVYGVLTSEPANIPWLNEGDAVKFPIKRISDWFLVPVSGSKPLGGFTIDILKSQLTPDQRKSYEQHPPLVWFKDRKVTASQELKQVPVCKQCGKRDLIVGEYRDGVCSICRGKLERCDCQKCSAPLFRHEETPHICKRCMMDEQRETGRPSKVARRSKQSSQFQQPASGLLEKVYHGLVIAVLAFVMLILSFMVFDPAGAQAQGRPMMLGLGSILILTLASTLAWNLYKGRLVVIPTVLQAIALVFTCIGVPVAAFGIVVLLTDRTAAEE